jgi:predicted alpha/beta-hydrolase family hydrolase
MTARVTPLRIPVPAERAVSALLRVPSPVHACFVFAHGAGAGMTHPFMADLAEALGARKIATLRFQFPSIEQGSKRPDTPAVAHATIRSAVNAACAELPGVPLFAGGKSFGARMTSQAQAESPLPHVRGLIFAGFPLHPSGKPSAERAHHLADVHVPMLFLQGTRDALADLSLVRTCAASLTDRARLHIVDGADHAFHVLARSGRTDAAVVEELAACIEEWVLQRI